MIKIIVDSGYRGELIDNTKKMFGWILEIVLWSDSSEGFQVLPKRWIVERTFSWFESGKDYEYKTDTSEAMIQLSMIKLMLNKIKI
jgi:putative transposase